MNDAPSTRAPAVQPTPAEIRHRATEAAAHGDYDTARLLRSLADEAEVGGLATDRGAIGGADLRAPIRRPASAP